MWAAFCPPVTGKQGGTKASETSTMYMGWVLRALTAVRASCGEEGCLPAKEPSKPMEQLAACALRLGYCL